MTDLRTQSTALGGRSSERGSILIYLVTALVVAGALGAGIVALTTSSTFSNLSVSPTDRARYLALSGLHYLRQVEILSLPVMLEFEESNGFIELRADHTIEELDPDLLVSPVVRSTGIVFPGSSRESRFMLERLISERLVSIGGSYHDGESSPPVPASNEEFSFKVYVRDQYQEHIPSLPPWIFSFKCVGCSNDEDLKIISVQERNTYYRVRVKYSNSESMRIDVNISGAGPISSNPSGSPGFGPGDGVKVDVQ